MPPDFSKLRRSLFAGSTVSQSRHDPYMAYNFSVEIGGVLVGGFSDVSGLSGEINLESYEEGGLNSYVHQFPKHTTYPRLILSHGVVKTDEFFSWYQATSQGHILLLNGTILLLDDRQMSVKGWTFKQAYPVKWEGPQFNASSDNFAVEKIELVHQGLTRS